jgi:hypothetical protein
MLYEVIFPQVVVDYTEGDNYGKPLNPQPQIRSAASRSLVEADDAKAAAIAVVRENGGAGSLPVEAIVNTPGESVTIDLTA